MSDVPSQADIRRAAREHQRYTYQEQQAYKAAITPLLERWKQWNIMDPDSDHMCRSRGLWWEVDHTSIPKRARWAFARPYLDDQWQLFGRVVEAIEARGWFWRLSGRMTQGDYNAQVVYGPGVRDSTLGGGDSPAEVLLSAYLDAIKTKEEA